jgi:TolB protein
MTRRTRLHLPALLVGAAVLVACAAVVLAAPREAEATFPGKNGRIAYQDWFSLVIYTINPNGSGKHEVTESCVYPSLADYSPTGKKITYTSCEGRLGKDLGISTINVGGGGKFRVTHVTHNNTDDEEPSYSPDGKKIVFSGAGRTFPYLPRTYDDEIYTIEVDGKNRVRLTDNATYDYYPDYSPNGRKIAFAGAGENANHIYTISAHGGDTSKVTKGYYPSYSPDGKKIVYSWGGDRNSAIYTINVGGGGASKVTEGGYPSWGSEASP